MECAEVEKMVDVRKTEAIKLRCLLLLGMLSMPPAVASAADRCDDRYRAYQREPLIVVDTKDCAGNDGLATFRADRVFRIQVGGCHDPSSPGQPLYQVMLRTLTGSNDYEVVWVNAAGMRAVREQLQENRQAALRQKDCSRTPDPPADEDREQN